MPTRRSSSHRPGVSPSGKRSQSPEERRLDADFERLSCVIEMEPELPGTLYRVPDRFWGFEAPGRVEHPNACVDADVQKGIATLLKGTSGRSQHLSRRAAVWVEPSAENGLRKPTAFQIRPRVFPLRRVALLHFDRRLGRLTDEQLAILQAELCRLFPKEAATSR